MSLAYGNYVRFQSDVTGDYTLLCYYNDGKYNIPNGSQYYIYASDDYYTGEGSVSPTEPSAPYPCNYGTLCNQTGPPGYSHPIVGCTFNLYDFTQDVTITNNSSDSIFIQWYPAAGYYSSVCYGPMAPGGSYNYSYIGPSIVSSFTIAVADTDTPCQLNCYGYVYDAYPPYDCIYSP